MALPAMSGIGRYLIEAISLRRRGENDVGRAVAERAEGVAARRFARQEDGDRRVGQRSAKVGADGGGVGRCKERLGVMRRVPVLHMGVQPDERVAGRQASRASSSSNGSHSSSTSGSGRRRGLRFARPAVGLRTSVIRAPGKASAPPAPADAPAPAPRASIAPHPAPRRWSGAPPSVTTETAQRAPVHACRRCPSRAARSGPHRGRARTRSGRGRSGQGGGRSRPRSGAACRALRGSAPRPASKVA